MRSTPRPLFLLSIRQFGERNAKAAVSRALNAASSSESEMRIALAELEHHQLCEASPPEGPQSDTWQLLGLRVCALLHLRTGDEGRALTILKSQLRASHGSRGLAKRATSKWSSVARSTSRLPRILLELHVANQQALSVTDHVGGRGWA